MITIMMTKLKVLNLKLSCRSLLVLIALFSTVVPLEAKILVEDNVGSEALNPGTSVGRSAAQKYFTKESSNTGVNSRLLSLHVGGYLRSKAYQWGDQVSSERAGVQTTGVTYKVGEWTRTMDLNLRLDYFQYEIGQEKPIKISFLPLLTFPDSGTNFPIYFGLGAGPGIFLNQLEKESSLTLDYQLIFGVRWNDIWDKNGFFIESGIKDHLHVLSDGQFTSQFLTAGAVFKL
ncbi:MAG: hypothetical protein RJB66_1067 [Pseudomonadota bacterium]|jgi:hypothetical protein